MTVGSPDMISSFPEEKGVFFLNFFFLTSSTLISHTGVRKTRRCIFFFFFLRQVELPPRTKQFYWREIMNPG